MGCFGHNLGRDAALRRPAPRAAAQQVESDLISPMFRPLCAGGDIAARCPYQEQWLDAPAGVMETSNIEHRTSNAEYLAPESYGGRTRSLTVGALLPKLSKNGCAMVLRAKSR